MGINTIENKETNEEDEIDLSYTVRQNDTLIRISFITGSDIKQIQRINDDM